MELKKKLRFIIIKERRNLCDGDVTPTQGRISHFTSLIETEVELIRLWRQKMDPKQKADPVTDGPFFFLFVFFCNQQ